MAEEVQHHHQQNKSDEPCFSDAISDTPKAEEAAAVESTDRGLFGFGGKKKEEEKCEEGPIAAEFGEKVQVSDEKKKDEEKKHGGLLDKLHRSGSSSSSSSDEEVEENGEKKKKKKDKKKKEEENKPAEGTEEKKGFLDKIKEKLPGGKKPDEVESPPPTPAAATECATTPEKKGFMDKIKEKIPGYGPAKTVEEKEKEAANH